MKSWWVICAWCKKKIRRLDETTWHDIDTIDPNQLKDINRSHGICPECENQIKTNIKNDHNPSPNP